MIFLNNNFVFITFFPVISPVLFSEFTLSLLFVSLIFLSFLILIYQNINISKFGHTIFVTVFSSSIVSFIMSDSFQENISYLVYLFLSLFFLKTLATLFYVQFSNYQFFFNFFASLLTMIAISSFYNYDLKLAFFLRNNHLLLQLKTRPLFL